MASPGRLLMASPGRPLLVPSATPLGPPPPGLTRRGLPCVPMPMTVAGPSVGGSRRGGQLSFYLVLYAVSIALIVHAQTGNMPWDVPSQGVARQLDWSFGTVVIVLSIAVLAC